MIALEGMLHPTDTLERETDPGIVTDVTTTARASLVIDESRYKRGYKQKKSPQFQNRKFQNRKLQNRKLQNRTLQNRTLQNRKFPASAVPVKTAKKVKLGAEKIPNHLLD